MILNTFIYICQLNARKFILWAIDTHFLSLTFIEDGSESYKSNNGGKSSQPIQTRIFNYMYLRRSTYVKTPFRPFRQIIFRYVLCNDTPSLNTYHNMDLVTMNHSSWSADVIPNDEGYKNSLLAMIPIHFDDYEHQEG